eukprot:CAMPEP_0185846826 /NCGR_PEP_ID=MMETSP1354-20130828/2326_1 /TAXON_ID=708628 /ORGANISM="Erythrolobus madagascarensis, Strain CCMP3276" /LENGTH=173 /DNA_ID=CAMNT_0028547033 /DNA_START=602 /DNA_END=1119 /DNA_ORIENTATION=-
MPRLRAPRPGSSLGSSTGSTYPTPLAQSQQQRPHQHQQNSLCSGACAASLIVGSPSTPQRRPEPSLLLLRIVVFYCVPATLLPRVRQTRAVNPASRHSQHPQQHQQSAAETPVSAQLGATGVFFEGHSERVAHGSVPASSSLVSNNIAPPPPLPTALSTLTISSPLPSILISL